MGRGHSAPEWRRTAVVPIYRGMKNLPMTEDEVSVLTRELTDITWNNRFQLSPRIRTLKAIVAKLKAEPARPAASPEPRVYEPPSTGQYRGRGPAPRGNAAASRWART
jgi:hypothetical protein